jgi:hypothetical protein
MDDKIQKDNISILIQINKQTGMMITLLFWYHE